MSKDLPREELQKIFNSLYRPTSMEETNKLIEIVKTQGAETQEEIAESLELYILKGVNDKEVFPELNEIDALMTMISMTNLFGLMDESLMDELPEATKEMSLMFYVLTFADSVLQEKAKPMTKDIVQAYNSLDELDKYDIESLMKIAAKARIKHTL